MSRYGQSSSASQTCALRMWPGSGRGGSRPLVGRSGYERSRQADLRRPVSVLRWEIVVVGAAQVPAERVFLVVPRLGTEGIKDKGKATRVDFALR